MDRWCMRMQSGCEVPKGGLRGLISIGDDRNRSSTLLGREHTHNCAELMAPIAAVRVQDGSFDVGSDGEYARACGYGSFARWETLEHRRQCGCVGWVGDGAGNENHATSRLRVGSKGTKVHIDREITITLDKGWKWCCRFIGICRCGAPRSSAGIDWGCDKETAICSLHSVSLLQNFFSKAWYFVCQFAPAAWLNCAALVPCVEHFGRSPKCRNCKSNFKERQVRGVCCRVRQHFLDGGNGWPKMPEARSTIRALRDMCKEVMMLTGAAREKLLQWRARSASSQTTWQRACFPQRGRHGESTARRVGASQCKWFGRCPAFPQEWTSLRDDCGRRRERRVCSRPSEPWDRHRRRNEIAIEADESL